MSLIKQYKRAFADTGCYHWQWRWRSIWRIWPHYSAERDVVDYGIPEYAHRYPTYQVNTFCFSGFQCQWYSDYQSDGAYGY